MKVYLILALFLAAVFALPSPGTYRQCTDVGDEIILEIQDDSDFEVDLTFSAGGCLDINDYEVKATFTINFGNQNSEGVYDVEYKYKSARATPNSDEARDALEATCSGNFQVGDSTDVRDCLFCDDTRYDIFFETSDGFILGDGLACDEDDRPVQLEEFQFYKTNDVSSASALSAVVCLLAFVVLLA